jgi:protein O-GlcNAc transferase
VIHSPAFVAAAQHLQRGELAQALAQFQHSIDAGDVSAEKSTLFLSHHWLSTNQLAEAVTVLERACAQFPNQVKWHATLAEAWSKLGDVERALACADRALALNPNDPVIAINRLVWWASRCDQPAQVRAAFEAWGHRHMDAITDVAVPFEATRLSPRTRLKVGYVSGDFKNHAVRYFIEPVLRHHDRAQVEVHAFMTLPGDNITPVLQSLVDVWHDVSGQDDIALWQLVRAQGIDVLVDLSGHTQGERLRVFAMRAAPVQITWFGYMHTLGLKAMDWRLSDHHLTPAGTDAFYTERLARLSAVLCYQPPVGEESSRVPVSPWQRQGAVTMVSLNHSRKLSDTTLQWWQRILLAAPEARLLLISAEKDPAQARSQLLPRLAGLGMPLARIDVSPRLNMAEFMALAERADFALDTYPVSGGTTTMHALWMGLPTLALRAPQAGAMAHYSASILEGVGLSECVAASPEEYIARAVNWANHPAPLSALRQRCRPALQASAYMDAPTHVRELEQAYQAMWAAWVQAPPNAHSEGRNPVRSGDGPVQGFGSQ